MRLRNHTTGYGYLAIALHWLMAVLVIGLFALGVYMMELDYYHPWYNTSVVWHYSLGLLTLFLLLFKLYWRLSNPVPAPLPSYRSWEVLAAKTVHWMTYYLLLLIGVSGYLILGDEGESIPWFDLIEIPILVNLASLTISLWGKVHQISAYILAVFVILHILAALKHHFYHRDVTLLRMLGLGKKQGE